MANKWFETVAEAQRRAKKRLPKSVYGALVAGSERGITVEDNVAAFAELGFAPHVAGLPTAGTWPPRSWARRSRSRSCSRPTGVQAVHPEGEVAVARAAAARGTAMGLSSFASMPIEEVVAAMPADVLPDLLDRHPRPDRSPGSSGRVPPGPSASSRPWTGRSPTDATGAARPSPRR